MHVTPRLNTIWESNLLKILANYLSYNASEKVSLNFAINIDIKFK